MVLNISGLIITDKLRDISLSEYDFNFSNKLYFERRLTKIACNSIVLPQEEHGSISEHASIEVALLRSLFF